MKNFYVLLIWALLLTACVGNSPTQADPDAVGTIVVGTLTTFPSATPVILPSSTTMVEPTATFTPEPPSVLPRSLYYLAQDANDKAQIYRLGRDGTTITQITFEQNGISNFDVSPVDNKIAYITKNNLIVVEANGENRQALMQDSNIIYSLTWSPDGKTIAYGKMDVVLYSLDKGSSEVLISGSDTEENSPVSFSPGGRKLLIRKSKIPSSPESPVFIYDFTSQTSMPIVSDNQPYPCFGGTTWDISDGFFCHGHVLAGGLLPGLWYINANDGSVESFVESFQAPFLLVNAPRRDTTGNLYYLYGEDQGAGMPYSPLSLVRSNTDSITNRVILRPEKFYALYALWTPDGNALLIAQNDGTSSVSKSLVLAPIDPSLPIMTLLADASALIPYSPRWGP